jgi:formate C-acetyltransferase
VVRSLHHLDGQRLGASADGRHAGEPVGDSLGAVAGTAMAGPTAMLQSVLRVDTVAHYPGGTNLNVTLTSGQATPECIEALVAGFFGEGGQEIQINVLDAATLRQAQADPASHGDLVVRVAGLCARFVELSRREQAELIARAEEAGPFAALRYT